MSRVPGVSQTTLWFSYILNSSVFSLYNTIGNPLPIQIIFLRQLSPFTSKLRVTFGLQKKLESKVFIKRERERERERESVRARERERERARALRIPDH